MGTKEIPSVMRAYARLRDFWMPSIRTPWHSALTEGRERVEMKRGSGLGPALLLGHCTVLYVGRGLFARP